MSLKNKRVLITAGPTWVPIDSVRVISNIATGETGISLADGFNKSGARVTLILGPVAGWRLNSKIKILRFNYFSDLRNKLKKELLSKKYDIIVHSAAVSDFKPKKKAVGKIDSSRNYSLKLVRLPKIIKQIRRIAGRAKLVMFKLESGVSDACLLRRAKIALKHIGADIVVANKINPYKAFIINKYGEVFPVKKKYFLARELLKHIT
ncbi:MAG: hypothetical protein DRP74_01565 [Candidatus Omnitrophota bacterium]|nr:MAG: hypothetical protein DRP74_01565 [Candidatus Omnitrophota bacterium]